MKYAILSDIHANYTALQAVLERLDWLSQASGVGFQTRVLGDLVGYGPMLEALECINWLQLAPRTEWIPGNHDEWILHPNGGVRFEARVTLLSQLLLLQRPENQDKWEWFSGKVTPLVTTGQPQVYQDILKDYTLAYSHAAILPGTERDIYLYPWASPLVERNLKAFRQQTQAEAFCLFLGHTHFPMFAVLENEEIKFQPIKYGQAIDLGSSPIAINPGSVGQPRDGDPRAAFAVLNMENRQITFYRADYNVAKVCEKLRSEQDINHINRPNRQILNHPLTRDERKALTQQLGIAGPYSATIDQVSAAYQNLITLLQSGDGGENTAKYNRIYRRPAWDLEV